MPGAGKVCVNCNAKRVQCSYLGAKVLAEIIISSDEEVAMPRPKKAKTSGMVPKAGKVSVEVGRLADGSAEILNAIQQQNSLLGQLLGFQQQTALATRLQVEWARPMTNYLGQITRALEAQTRGQVWVQGLRVRDWEARQRKGESEGTRGNC
jgi:hypothetical protein